MQDEQDWSDVTPCDLFCDECGDDILLRKPFYLDVDGVRLVFCSLDCAFRREGKEKVLAT